MNYYQNYNNPNGYYVNYPYNLNNMPYGQAATQPQQIQQPPQGLNGKIVDSEDVVKATEVPIGSYGIFPKADLSEIYIKTWNNNGTTNIVTFKPDVATGVSMLQEALPTVGMDSINLILDRITQLESKLDGILNPAPASVTTKKEVNTNATSY